MTNTLSQLPITTAHLDPALSDSNILVGTLASRILVYSIALAGMYFFVRTVVAGFTFLTSLGDPGKIQAAQQTLIHSLVGLIIVISAFFLAQIVYVVFGVNLGLTP